MKLTICGTSNPSWHDAAATNLPDRVKEIAAVTSLAWFSTPMFQP